LSDAWQLSVEYQKEVAEGLEENTYLPVPEDTPTPAQLWLLSTYNPMFFVGLMAKYGYTVHAWKANPEPPQIMPWIPPRPQMPIVNTSGAPLGSFEGQNAPQFGGNRSW
jgi:hypothetical protein